MDSHVFYRFLPVDVKSIGASFFDNLLYLCLRLSSCPYRIFWVCFSRRHVDWLKTSFILFSQFEFNGLILFGMQYFYVRNARFSNILINLKKKFFFFFLFFQSRSGTDNLLLAVPSLCLCQEGQNFVPIFDGIAYVRVSLSSGSLTCKQTKSIIVLHQEQVWLP